MMKGVIKTYLPEKQYGFIKGDDGKDYFFHTREFKDQSQVNLICEDAIVSFDQQATPKGYKAKQCSLASSTHSDRYIVPEEFITSRNGTPKGWEVIEEGKWIIHGSSRSSPDAAKANAIENAQHIAANALINFEYYKETGSEPGTGKGTYYFTVHNFRGRATVLGRRNANGKYLSKDLIGMNKKADALKAYLREKTQTSQSRRNFVWIFTAVFFVASLYSLIFAPLAGTGLIAAFFIRATDYDWWLQRE